jgi:hypothetical protein
MPRYNYEQRYPEQCTVTVAYWFTSKAMELQLYTSATAKFYVKNLESLQLFFFNIEKRFTKWSLIELQNTYNLSYYKFFNMFSCICMYLQTWDSVSFEMSPKRLCVYIYAYYNLFMTFF